MTKNSKSIIGSFGNIESPQYLPHTDFLKRMLLSDELNAPKINDINEQEIKDTKTIGMQ